MAEQTIRPTMSEQFTYETTVENGHTMLVRTYATQVPDSYHVKVRVDGKIVGNLFRDGSAWIAHRDHKDSETFDHLDREAFLGAIRLVHIL